MRLAALLGLAFVVSSAALADQPSQIPAGKIIPLGGTVIIPPAAFERTSPARLACQSTAFTAAEIAVAARGKVATAMVAGKPVQLVTLHNGKQVPLTDYVNQLNAVEAFYNANGVTLRHGPFAVSPGSGPAAPPTKSFSAKVLTDTSPVGRVVVRPGRIVTLPRLAIACASRDTLGPGVAGKPLVSFRLIDPPPPDQGPRFPKLPGRTGAKIPDIIFDPGDRRDANILVFDPATNAIDSGALARLGSQRDGLRGTLSGRFATGDARARLIVPALNAVSSVPGFTPKTGFGGSLGVTQVRSGCAKFCTLQYGVDAFMTAPAAELAADPNQVVYTTYHCTVLTDGTQVTDPAKCVSAGYDSKKDTRRIDLWQTPGVQTFLADPKNPCAVLDALIKLEGEAKAQVDLANYYDLGGSGSGNEKKQTGTAAGNFFDGLLNYSNSGIADCLIDSGSNGFFGAHVCLTYATFDHYAKKDGFHINNTASEVANVTLFGVKFDLVDGTASSDWKAGGQLQTSAAVTNPVISSNLEQHDDKQNFEGPGAFFFIGPVPVSIRSFATVAVGVNDPLPDKFVAPPLVPNVAGVGHVGMGVGASADVTVGFDAAVDALILKAGLEGKLTLLHATIGGGIATSVDPLHNNLWVDKTYGIKATMLAGKVSAFVEVDLIVYTEKYTIDIVSFDGIDKSIPFNSQRWDDIHALIPATIKTTPDCP